VAEGVQLVVDAENRSSQKEELGDYHANACCDVVRLADDERCERQSSSSNEAANCRGTFDDSITVDHIHESSNTEPKESP